MANSGLAQRQTQPNNAYHCKECSMYFDSMKSLDVHLHYHKENLLSKWATQASFNEESNNNNTHKNGNNAKGNNKNNHHHDYKSTIAAPADSSDTSSGGGGGGGGGMMKKCAPLAPTALPGRTLPPSSYRTSPPSNGVPYSQGNYTNPGAYQGDPQRFSPANGHQMFAYQNGMPNRTPPPSFQPFGQQNYVMRPAESNQNSFYDGNNLIQQNYPNNGEPFSNSLSMSSSTPSSVSSPSPSSTAPISTSGFRYHPYQHTSSNSTYAGDRGGVVSSSSYAPRPTSPQQCDKCGTICDTRDALGEHLSVAHPPTPVGQQYQPPPPQQQQQQQRNGNNGFSSVRVKEEAFDPFHSEVDIKQEDEPQAEILDLDSHKVHVYQPPEEEESSLRGPGGNPHSVSAMLWGNNHSSPPEPSPKSYQNMHSPPERKTYHQQQLGRNPTPDYVTSTLTSPQPDLVPQQAYQQQQQQQQQRYLQVPDQPQPGIQPQQPITSSQVPNNTPSLPTQPNSPQLPPQPTTGKGNSWKSNEARRPKTYNCSACNKWFTSSGHLKRHYNTTLHKNAVKQSGQPDPSTFPINTHHHPHRDPNYVPRGRRDEADTIISPVSSLGNEDSSRSDEYGRITPGGQNSQMLLPPPMNGGLMSNGGGVVHNPMIASPPNRLAGPPDYPHSGGLHSMMTSPPHNANYIHETRHTMEPTSVHRQPPHQIMRHSPSPSAMIHHPSPQDMMQHHNSPPEMMHLHSPSDMIHHPTSEMMHISAGGPPELMRRPSPTHMMHHTSPPHLVHHPQPHPVALLTSAQMEQQMMQNYPNALPPHVTTNLTPLQTIHTNTNQITSTGNPENDNNTQHLLSLGSASLEELQPMQHYFGSLNGNMFHMPIQQALPSFAQFGHQGAGGYPPGQTLTMLQNMGGMVSAPNYMVHAADHNVGGLMHPSPNNINNNQQHHYLLMESYQPNNVINNNNNNYIAEEVDNVTSLNGDRFNSDSNTSLGESLLSPVGTPDCPTSTKSDFEHVVIKVEDSDPGGKEDNLTVSSTNEINIYSSNSISNGTLHKCIDCDKVFNKACYLTQHNKSFHSGLKPFKCHRCGKRFPAEYLYEEHLTKHAGDKPYKCEICPKQFNHKTDLRRHMCLHTGEKPYACEICGKGFIRKDHMLKHCITHRRKLNIQQQQQHIIAQ